MPRQTPMLDDARTVARFLRALGPFLADPIPADESRRRLVERLGAREASFLRLLRETIYGQRTSPYRTLLAHAGIEFGDVEQFVRADGLEAALGRLHDAGVRVTLDEFKGRSPVRRGSLEIATTSASFDRPSSGTSFVARSGGSRGTGRRLLVDLDLLALEACHEQQTVDQFGLGNRVRALWRPVPPGSAGLKGVLRFAKIGAPFDRWFSQNPVWSLREWRHTAFLAATGRVAARAGHWLPAPEHVPVHDASTVARWLADERSRGRAALLDTNVTAAVRVCQAAQRAGLAIDGTMFRVGGEPLTEAKAAVVGRSGCRAFAHYSMSEVGRVADACGTPAGLDDAHVAIDKVALVTRDVQLAGAQPVAGLFLTTLVDSTPKVMLNVELGDYATAVPGRCGCLWERLGFTHRLRDIRSYEKLTADGMHFIGTDLLRVVEDILPTRFGGGATDYQLVEEEVDSATVVTLLASPRLGPLDESALASAFLGALGSGTPASRMMAERWRDAGTVRVVRGEPRATHAGKILALHVPVGGRDRGR